MGKTKAGTASRATCPLSPKYEQAKALYESGMSIQDVADFYGVRRTAMWDILKRRGTIMRPKPTGAKNHFYRGGPTASDRAQNLLETAIQKGIIQRRISCEQCGATPVFKDGRTGIQAHHADYSKPLDVMWLCQRCHHKWHKSNRAANPERR